MKKRSKDAQERFVRKNYSAVAQPCLSSFLQTCRISLAAFWKLVPDSKYITVGQPLDISVQCFWSPYAAGKLTIWLNMYFPASRSVTAGLLVCFRFVPRLLRPSLSLCPAVTAGQLSAGSGGVWGKQSYEWPVCFISAGISPSLSGRKSSFLLNTGGSVKLQQPDKFSLMISLSSSDTSPLYVGWRFGLLLTKSATVRKHQTCARVRMLASLNVANKTAEALLKNRHK